MAERDSLKERERQMLAEFALYDEHVDVVSAFEWIFTDYAVQGLPDTVRHFERFPKIPTSKSSVTPDFTVSYQDGSGLIGEIANIAQHENSVDKLCKQLLRYDSIHSLPGSQAALAETQGSIDVVQLVRFDVGLHAVRRIIDERLENPHHWYKPSKRPVLVQYARDDTKYTFQRIPDPRNGVLKDTQRDPDISKYLNSGLNIRAEKFTRVKSGRAFINDPIPPLYLATHLWLRTIPGYFGRTIGTVSITADEITRILNEQYGHIRISDVRSALSLLKMAGLAEEEESEWTIARSILGKGVEGDRAVQQLIARRAIGTSKPRAPLANPKWRRPKTHPDQGQLF